MNSFLVRIVAKAVWLFLSPTLNRSMICMWLHNIFALILASILKLLNTQFPADTIANREERGVAVKFFESANPSILVNLDNTVTAQYTRLVKHLDLVSQGKAWDA
jgi:hypothetical protein